MAQNLNKNYMIVNETEKTKYLPGKIVEIMKNEGYPSFTMHTHTQLWKEADGQNPVKNYGARVAKTWYWYESWLKIVRDHCKKNAVRYQKR